MPSDLFRREGSLRPNGAGSAVRLQARPTGFNNDVLAGFDTERYVGRAQRDFTSIVHFLEGVYGLPSLGQLDARTGDRFGRLTFSGRPMRMDPSRLAT